MDRRVIYWLVTSKLNRDAFLAITDGPILVFCSKDFAEKHVLRTNLPDMDFIKMDKTEMMRKFGEDCYVLLDPQKPLKSEDAVPIWYLQENFQ